MNHEPAFAWWIPIYVKHKDRIIKSIRSCSVKKNVKFGLEIPKTVEEALKIDRNTKTTYWQDAIEKELSNNRVTFQILAPAEKVTPCYN
jgi:hypothetical protein